MAFAAVTLGAGWFLMSVSPSHRLQWEWMDGPPAFEPGWLSPLRYSECSTLVLLPYLAILLGTAAGAVARFAPPPGRSAVRIAIAIVLIWIAILLLRPGLQ